MDQLSFDYYYMEMAVAWTISIAFMRYEERITAYLQNNRLDNWTYNKALQKIVESRKISTDTKNKVKQWKR